MNSIIQHRQPFSLIQTLKDLDAIKITRFSLPKHAIETLSEHERENYFGLLALLLLAGGNISANQQRLLELLLPAMGLAGKLPTLMARAHQLEQKDLESSIDLLKEQQLSSTFIVDALVLCRLEQPLNQDQCRILAELVVLLGLHQADMKHLAKVAALILGLSQADNLPSDFNPASLRLDCWDEFLYRELTADHLKNGAHNGYWRISAPLSVDFPWSLTNAKVYFSEQGRLDVVTAEEIQVFHTNFINPVISITGEESNEILINNCYFEGSYAKSNKTTAFTLNNIKTEIENCAFNIKNARALRIISGKTRISTSQFNDCGHPNLAGGGISSHSDYLKIKKTAFSYCQALIAGGIRATSAMMTNCIFDNCSSSYIKKENHELENPSKSIEYINNAGGIFIDHTTPSSKIESSTFKNSSVKISIDGSDGGIKNCNLIDSILLVESGFGCRECTFSASNQDNKIYLREFRGSSYSIPKQSWWDDF